MSRFEVHSHTHYSNLRLLDCINRPKELVKRAIELNLNGIAITDHECISSHIELNQMQQEIQKDNPDFKIALGNEIYLVKDRESGQKYYHFILIAKNAMGHRALRELSSRAWLNSYFDRGMERCATTYDDLKEIVGKYPNSLIATTACLGGELSSEISALNMAEACFDIDGAKQHHERIVEFVLWCKELFGDDFYFEIAPGQSKDQVSVNKRMSAVATAFGVKMVIGTDAHFLKKEDRYVHKAYLNSKDGEREIDSFYEYSYLQSNEEIIENLKASNLTIETVEEMFNNSVEIYDKIENFSLLHKQQIPSVEVKDYPKQKNVYVQWDVLNGLFESDNIVERYWVNQCVDKLSELGKHNNEYLDRLEEEARVKKVISEKLGTNMFAYPVTLQHYVDMFWECGSTVGAGRGSSCSGLNHYLLGVTQLDPIEWDLPFWRYLNDERVELGDIDIDLSPSKRPIILDKIKEERGRGFREDIDSISKKNLGCTLIATFGTEATRSAILTACRGYRSEEYPDGIDVDTAQYLSALVPAERGVIWTLNEVLNGDKEKGRKPIKPFINEVNQYPGLVSIMLSIEGLINKRSSHASGVILFDEDPYEFGSFMRTPTGEVITAYDLHMAEAAGMTKYDFLVTEVQDKITQAIKFLQEDGEIDPDLSLREVYNKYLHPSVLPIEDMKYWKALHENKVLNCFQFDSEVGSQAAKKIKPSSILEMADANGLMRLMTAEKGEETPMEKYIRFKNNINLWYQEMKEFGLTEQEVEVLKPYFLKSHGVPPSQEQLMQMLMDENICHFSLAEANAARKIVGKKQISKIPELQKKVLEQAASPCLGHYVWKCGVGPQMGYSFSIIHALAYSFIGFQTVYLATHFNPIYWNTACLVVNSGSLEEDIEQVVSIYEKEDADAEYVDLPDRSGKIKKEKATDYAKIAKALGETLQAGIKVSLVDINKSGYSFVPDAENNEILFGMKALGGVGGQVIEEIKAGRPYVNFTDFLNRCPIKKSAMISLIKGGAFDRLEKEWAKELGVHPRYLIMTYYLSKTSEPKSKLTLQNFNGLLEKGLIPDSLDHQKRVFAFNKYLKSFCKVGKYYVFNDMCMDFYNRNYNADKLEVINGCTCILQTAWDKIYKAEMDTARDWLKEHQEETLKEFNHILFMDEWNKYAQGNLSSWEMEALCFYYHEHELANIDNFKYGISNFFDLSSQPVVDYFFKRNGKDIPIYKTYKIIGTVISKNDNKSSITLLTPNGVVDVKFTKEYYAMFARQISEKQEDGKKKVMEKGWMTRGTKLMITGIRRDDQFVAKTYSHTPTHQIYKIEVVNGGRDMELSHDRYGMGGDND